MGALSGLPNTDHRHLCKNHAPVGAAAEKQLNEGGVTAVRLTETGAEKARLKKFYPAHKK